MWEPKHKHRPCPCGCGELADECMRPTNGLNAFAHLTPTRSAAFPARYAGRYASCDEAIREGHLIRMTDDGAIHDDCSDHEPAPERPVTVCVRCWLTKPCECDD